MAEGKTITRTIPAHTEERIGINWGPILKTALIVGLVAAAGFAVFSIVGPLIAGSPTAAGFIGGATQFVQMIGGFLGQALSFVGTIIGDALAGTSIGAAASTASLSPAASASIGAWTLGGLAAAGVAIATRAPQHLWNAVTNLFTHQTVNVPERTVAERLPAEQTPRLASPQTVQAIEADTAARSSQTLASHADSASYAPSTAWADRVSQTSARRDITPRNASHGAQIQEEQALKVASGQALPNL